MKVLIKDYGFPLILIIIFFIILIVMFNYGLNPDYKPFYNNCNDVETIHLENKNGYIKSTIYPN